MPQPINQGFDHALTFGDDGRVLIKSTCKTCGFSGIVSVADDSLSDWETRHACGNVRVFYPRLPNRGPQPC